MTWPCCAWPRVLDAPTSAAQREATFPNPSITGTAIVKALDPNQPAVIVRLLEDPGREARVAIDMETAALGAWVGPVRVVPRFRTPLEQELAAAD